MNPQLERMQALCQQLNLLHLPGQLAHLGQLAASRELGYLDFLEQALRGEAMARTERHRLMLTRLAGFPVIKTADSGASRSSIPPYVGPPFRGMPVHDSGPCRSS